MDWLWQLMQRVHEEAPMPCTKPLYRPDLDEARCANLACTRPLAEHGPNPEHPMVLYEALLKALEKAPPGYTPLYPLRPASVREDACPKGGDTHAIQNGPCHRGPN